MIVIKEEFKVSLKVHFISNKKNDTSSFYKSIINVKKFRKNT